MPVFFSPKPHLSNSFSKQASKHCFARMKPCTSKQQAYNYKSGSLRTIASVPANGDIFIVSLGSYVELLWILESSGLIL